MSIFTLAHSYAWRRPFGDQTQPKAYNRALKEGRNTMSPPSAPPPPQPSAGASSDTSVTGIERAALVADPLPSARLGRGKFVKWAVLAIILIVVAIVAIPWIHQALSTVSTDDAYVNGHVTTVAARVPGQVVKVLVDDNNRVRKGDLLVQLDKEPYQIRVDARKAALETARADVAAAEAEVRGLEAKARSLRWKLQHSIEDVDNQIALLKTNVAGLDSAKAVQTRARADLERAKAIVQTGAVAREELDRRQQVLAVADAQVQQALQAVYQTRVSLGLPVPPTPPENSQELAKVPADLDQTFSSVRQAQAELHQAAAQIGVEYSFDTSPSQMLADFYKRDPEGNIDRIYAKLLTDAPAVKQAQAKLQQADQDLKQAELDLRYTDVLAEIDGVVTRRNINPGNNVVAGQGLMAIRSLREIWVDANFKETQLADLRLGQRVELHVDMYGKHHVFAGHVSGFTMGTGSTLALLPAQNATGNFVKVVQRLPVRIDLDNYNPDEVPLFIGLSVTPDVFINEPPTGPDAGKLLQPYLPNSGPTSAPTTQAAKP
jgi:membrane fusion protein (multidrug efflux system)